jgi:hypothetical protein
MPNQPEKPADSSWLEKYLDSAPDSPERAEMDRAMSSNQQMQVELQLQMQIDESLKRLFVPSAAPADLLAKLQAPTPLAQPTVDSRRNWKKLALAAIAVSVVWGFLIWRLLPPSRPVAGPYKNSPLATIYEQSVGSGFQPYWVCKDPHQFASTFFSRQGQGLLLADMPAGTKMEGLDYTGGITQNTTTMLARTDGQPILIFVDRASADNQPVLPAESKLHLFRKELGPLVIYELSPLDHATVMDSLYLADVPPETTNTDGGVK